jgi:hypothetical protein
MHSIAPAGSCDEGRSVESALQPRPSLTRLAASKGMLSPHAFA